MSGVAIGRAKMRPVAGRASIDDILLFGPTVERVFDRSDLVLKFTATTARGVVATRDVRFTVK